MDPTTYQLPGDNVVTISESLTNEIRTRFKRDRENRFKLYLLCHGMRLKYLDPKSNSYAQEFNEWYENADFKSLFGELPNFTKFAAAGEVIDFIASKTTNAAKYLSKLPVSKSALYEISKIIKADEEAFHACLEYTPERKRINEPKIEWKLVGGSLINVTVTAAVITDWLDRWQNPEKPPKQPKAQDPFNREVKLLTVSVNKNLFEFNQVGDQIGDVDLEQVQSLIAKIQQLFTSANEKQFLLETEIDAIRERFEKSKIKNDPLTILKDGKMNRAKQYK